MYILNLTKIDQIPKKIFKKVFKNISYYFQFCEIFLSFLTDCYSYYAIDIIISEFLNSKNQQKFQKREHWRKSRKKYENYRIYRILQASLQ